MTDITDGLPLQLTKVPGPRGLPLVGVAFDFIRDPLRYMERMLRQYGRIYRVSLGQTSLVLLHDADLVEKVLRLDFASYGMSRQQEALLGPLLGHSMPVVTDHAYWEQLHSMMLPMFSPKMLQGYLVQTVAAVQEEVDHLAELQHDGKTVEMYDFVRAGVFGALMRTLFVRGLEHSEIPQLLDWFSRTDTYINALVLSGGSSLVKLLPKVRDGARCLKRIDERVYRLIAERKAHRVDEPEDMLDVLLAAVKKDGSPLSDVELRDNVVALLFGGQETTPTIATWAFGLLAANPDKRRIMLDEIDRVLQGRVPTWADLAKLEYTEMVLDEALRLYPPFLFIGREALVDTSLEGYEISKGTSLGFVAWTVHRDPRLWPDPERFEPERHSKEQKRSRAKCAFLSFGHGQRRCVGERVGRMEGLLMLSMISQRFLLDHANGKLPEPRVQMAIKPAGGMHMRITPRVPQQ
ncbi:MAG: cytochrome [Hydrocarboniphaga sp.]|uniref:cytochrome P450 n=1 Tax=Hydrocarboniphaga sp. TaxID=2033016 RepID=UPI00260C1E1B|nr:cytochrome P450 [Hydrocarboniphaga sp.]MDB5969992.1 cytochrome [Hydrocarboniphaga sp.]